MNTKFDLEKFGAGIVYVKSVDTSQLSDDLRDQVGNLTTVFAVHNASGEQIALVANRKLAFHLARENDMQPVTVH